MNVEIERQNIIIFFGNNKAAQFHFWEYMNQNQTFILDSHRPFICSVGRGEMGDWVGEGGWGKETGSPPEYVILDDFLSFYSGYTRALPGVIQWPRIFHILDKFAITWCNCILPGVSANT